VHEIELKRVRGRWLGFDKEVDEVKNHAAPNSCAKPRHSCAAIQFHREYGAITNPKQLRPGLYQLKVEAKDRWKRSEQEGLFNVPTCGFNGTIVVDF
jgi:hypothetical protein